MRKDFKKKKNPAIAGYEMKFQEIEFIHHMPNEIEIWRILLVRP